MGFIAGSFDPAGQPPPPSSGHASPLFTAGEGPIALAADRALLTSPDGRHLLAFDGHLDNADELRHAYAHEYPFADMGDAEVVLAALALDGPKMLQRLSGAFALLLWDREARRCLAARDPLGVKPLFFTRSAEVVRFSSSVAGLGPLAPDLDALVEWVLVPELARGALSRVESVPPGGLLELDASGLRSRRWWSLRPPARPVDPDALVDDVLRHVYVGTSASATTEGSAAVLLSGGFASGLLTAVAGFMQDGLQAFTLQGDPQATADAAALCAEAEVEHHRVSLPDAETPRSLATTLPWSEQQLGQGLLLGVAREHASRVLVGDGASVLHFGLPLFEQAPQLGSPRALLEALRAPDRHALLHPSLSPEPHLARMAQRLEHTAREAGLDWDSADARAQATRALLVEHGLPAALEVREAQARALEVELRLPFASTELLRLAARVPPSLALRDGLGMWHLRRGLRDELPEAIRWASPRPHPALLPDALLRAQALAGLKAPLVASILDVPALLELARRPGPLGPERGRLMAVVALSQWAAAHGFDR